MAEEIKDAVVEETPAKKAPAKKASPKKASKKEEKKVEEKKFSAPIEHDFEVIIEPFITEKTMALMQNANKVTVKVAKWANKIEIKDAFERIFQVKVTAVKVANQIGKTTTRGGRYRGTIPGFKKAIITLADGEAIDLFKE